MTLNIENTSFPSSLQWLNHIHWTIRAIPSLDNLNHVFPVAAQFPCAASGCEVPYPDVIT